MKKRVMWIIIGVMAISMIGIGIIQMIWFDTAIDQDKKNFDDKVTIALGIVKERLLEDAQNDNYAYRNMEERLFKPNKYYDQLYEGDKTPFELKKLNNDLKARDIFIFPETFLERIDKDKLDTYINHEIDQQGIKLDFDYGVYSNEVQSFIIMNGNYTAQITSSGNSSSPVKTGNELYNSPYQISLFNSPVAPSSGDTEKDIIPGYLKIYFPAKNQYLWSAVIPSLVMSILFTGLVLFCFGYVIYIVLRQKQISEMKTDFINNMTHEFKTPIATISLAADSIGSPMILGNDDKVLRFTNIIKQENKRMLGQVEKVLQMAMLDKKDFQLKLSNIDVHQLIEVAAEHTNLKILKRNGILRTDLKANNQVIQADSTHISNIIHNLLDNAEKYSSEEVEITIETFNKKNGIVINISDNGIGMSKDQVKNIFEKFYRAHTGNIHNVKGFGLGLSYVKAIVDAHNGTINVKSELGKGSTFSVYLPHKPV
ncbi:MAG: HAMP domain-containing sensor histidine kinase [Saprospiraceae bacterium]|nr:HAMP domain-containing sensor histidine kinase [Saprospiraceae bacterium]